MLKRRLSPLALALTLALANGAGAASLTPPNLVAATSLNNPDLLLVWPYSAGGPLEQMSWSVFKGQIASGLSTSFLVPGNNLSDVANPTIARSNLGLTLGTSGANLCLLNSACTWSALQSFAASTTSGASINIAPGVAPTSPNNGDVWETSVAIQARINSNTYTVFYQTTWTPTVSFTTAGNLSVSYTVQDGYLTQIGHHCTALFWVQGTPTYTSASGQFEVVGLPVSWADMEAGGGQVLNDYTLNIASNAVVYTNVTGGTASNAVAFKSSAGAIGTTQVPSGSAMKMAGTISYYC